MSQSKLPSYRDLPIVEGGGRSAWHLFGDSDEVGLINLLTPDKVADAARLVVTGERFALMPPDELFDPPFLGRKVTQHTVYQMLPDVPLVFDDYYDHYYPQRGGQWDSLAHFGVDPGVFYNGFTDEDIRDRQRLGIHNWANVGIAGRAVLLDFVRNPPEGFEPAAPYQITVEDLERVRRSQHVEIREGDVLIIRTGFLEEHIARPDEARAVQAEFFGLRFAGLDKTEQMAEYLWDLHICALAMDNPGIEVHGPREPDDLDFNYLHRTLIGQFGMALGELWWLKELAAACAAADRWEFFLTSAPINTRGGIGSPVNALAIM